MHGKDSRLCTGVLFYYWGMDCGVTVFLSTGCEKIARLESVLTTGPLRRQVHIKHTEFELFSSSPETCDSITSDMVEKRSVVEGLSIGARLSLPLSLDASEDGIQLMPLVTNEVRPGCRCVSR